MSESAYEVGGRLSDGPQISPVPRISVQAFCETAGVAQVIELAAEDRRMAKAHVKVHMGGVAAAVEAFRSAPTPNLVVLEFRVDRETLVDQLEQLAEYCDSGTKVVVVGHENDIALYRDLVSRGVSDYIVAPLDILTFIQQVSALYHSPGADSLGRVIGVVGAKGGVGASCIAHNLAWSISSVLDYQVVIADLDLPFGTAGLDFNQDPPQGIAEAVFSPDRLDANFVDRLLSKCSETLSILAAPATIDKNYDLADTAFDSIIDILRAAAPCTVLDIPHLWNGWTRRVLISVDELVVVANPDLANLRNAKSIIDSMRGARPNDRPPRLVINNVGVPRRPEIAVAEFAKAVELTPAAIIGFDPKLFGTAANNGQMIAEVEAGSKIVESFDELGLALMGKTSARKPKKTLLSPWLERFVGKKAG